MQCLLVQVPPAAGRNPTGCPSRNFAASTFERMHYALTRFAPRSALCADAALDGYFLDACFYGAGENANNCSLWLPSWIHFNKVKRNIKVICIQIRNC